MRHGVRIGPYNTWDDFHLTPTKKCVVQPPIEKTITLNVPGMNGYADLSASVTGYPIYKDRTGSWTFYLNPGEGRRVWDVYRDMVKKLAKLCQSPAKVILDDEPTFYYLGKVWVSGEPSQSDSLVKFTLKYQLSPIKFLVKPLEDDWLWDDANFETDLFPQKLSEFPVKSSASWLGNSVYGTHGTRVTWPDYILLPYSDVPAYVTAWATGGKIRFQLQCVYSEATSGESNYTVDTIGYAKTVEPGGEKASVLIDPKELRQGGTIKQLGLIAVKEGDANAVLHCAYQPGYV